VLLSVRNYGSKAVATTVALDQNGTLVSREPVNVPARTGVELLFVIQNVPSVVTARLELSDALAADNTRAVVVSPNQIRVAAIGASPYVEKALLAHPGVAIVPLRSIGAAEDAAAFDVVVCDGCAELPPGNANALLFPPRPSRRAEPVPMTMSDDAHALTDSLSLDGVPAVPIASRSAIGESHVIATAGGIPVVVASTSGTRRIVNLHLDPTAPELALSPAFPMLIANALQWLAAGDQRPVTIVAGEPLTWAMSSAEASSTIAVSGPDGRSLASTVAGGVLSVAATRAAGVYRVRGAGPEQRFVVNPAAGAESDLSREIKSADRGPGGFQPDLEERGLTSLLLLAALGVLIVEYGRRVGVRASRPL
jgi:hypothetical protein